MIVYPPAKINLGLRVLYKRPDNFHEISSVMAATGLCDELEISASLGTTSIEMQGIGLDTGMESNLCYKAWDFLRRHYYIPPVKIRLKKNIPSGAGLGGGSADAAYTLTCLNKLFALGLPRETLLKHAAELGSDVPFFINPSTSLVSGRGENIEAFELDFSSMETAIFKPPESISTKEAYQLVQPSIKGMLPAEVLKMPLDKWREGLVNDFEKGIFSCLPVLKDIKSMLYDAGAFYASLSGSGSAVYGLFHKGQCPDLSSRKYFVWQG